MKIGVFDSGIGGQAIARELGRLIPDAQIISVNDHNHVPYGSRQPDDIINLTLNAVEPLVEASCDVMVIACNTASTIAIDSLRTSYPDVKFIGLDPMVKPAAKVSKTKSITVLATPATLKSDRYNYLKRKWAADIKVHEPDCSSWASLIESGRIQDIDLAPVIYMIKNNSSDVVVLACTHYHFLKDTFNKLLDGNHITILEPSGAVAGRIHQSIG